MPYMSLENVRMNYKPFAQKDDRVSGVTMKMVSKKTNSIVLCRIWWIEIGAETEIMRFETFVG